MNTFLIFLAVILLLVLSIIIWGILIYNQLVSRNNMVKEGWSGIDVQLKRRADLVPNLVEAVKGYMGHESNVLQNVTEIRQKAMNAKTMNEREQAEGMLSAALSKIFAIAENYPDLKASKNFVELQRDLTMIEDQIQLSRRYYNGSARDYNILIQSFPSSLVATKFQFETVPYFELENAAERAVPQVKF